MEEWTLDELPGVVCKAAEYNTHHRKCIEVEFVPSYAMCVA